jgi:hypothetical protein
MSDAMQIAERIYSLAQEQNNAALMIGADRALAATLYFWGNFEASRLYAMHAVQIWRSGTVQSYAEEYYAPIVGCLVYLAKFRMAFGRDRLLREDYGRSDLTSKGAK